MKQVAYGIFAALCIFQCNAQRSFRRYPSEFYDSVQGMQPKPEYLFEEENPYSNRDFSPDSQIDTPYYEPTQRPLTRQYEQPHSDSFYEPFYRPEAGIEESILTPDFPHDRFTDNSALYKPYKKEFYNSVPFHSTAMSQNPFSYQRPSDQYLFKEPDTNFPSHIFMPSNSMDPGRFISQPKSLFEENKYPLFPPFYNDGINYFPNKNISPRELLNRKSNIHNNFRNRKNVAGNRKYITNPKPNRNVSKISKLNHRNKISPHRPTNVKFSAVKNRNTKRINMKNKDNISNGGNLFLNPNQHRHHSSKLSKLPNSYIPSRNSKPLVGKHDNKTLIDFKLKNTNKNNQNTNIKKVFTNFSTPTRITQSKPKITTMSHKIVSNKKVPKNPIKNNNLNTKIPPNNNHTSLAVVNKINNTIPKLPKTTSRVGLNYISKNTVLNNTKNNDLNMTVPGKNTINPLNVLSKKNEHEVELKTGNTLSMPIEKITSHIFENGTKNETNIFHTVQSTPVKFSNIDSAYLLNDSALVYNLSGSESNKSKGTANNTAFEKEPISVQKDVTEKLPIHNKTSNNIEINPTEVSKENPGLPNEKLVHENLENEMSTQTFSPFDIEGTTEYTEQLLQFGDGFEAKCLDE